MVSISTIRKANSWQQFTDLQAPLGQKQRGNAFELLTELFLQIDPVYRSKLKSVWHESNLPSSIRTKLGLPSPEIGVDLVAETYDGEYWAIQCKYHHDSSRNLSYGELKSFLDISTRVCAGKFSNLLAVSSAYGYSRNLQKHASEVQYCLSDRFQNLDQEFFRQARAVIRKQIPKYQKRKPRQHQIAAIENATEHFITNRASLGKLIHPCGTGKSLIGYWIAEALEAKTILVALPSLYLVRQTLTDWTKESLASGRQLDWMVVCSEDTITDLSKGDPSMRFQDIGVDVTTDVERIARFLRRRTTDRKVIFTTYQSGYATAEAAGKANRVFDVGVFDEAHRTVGRKDSLFSHLISDANIRIRRRVFMTATERRYQGSSDTILSMDDVDAYGETFDLMTFKEALEQKPPILSDYKIVTMVIGKSEIQHLIDGNFLVKPDKGRWDDDTEARTLAAMIALRKVMRDYKASHALTFHNSIAKAEAFQRSQRRFNTAVEGFGPVDCFHVSSKVSTGERKAELDRFRDSRKALITNAKCLTEGVDVPTIDAVLFAETKRSTIDIVQAAGRALRPADGKKSGYIVVPVLVDENDPDAADKAFQDILMVLRAMASNDDRIIDYFRSINRGQRPTRLDSIIDFNVPDPVRVRLDQFVEDIETRTWHRLAKLSWMPFEEAREFVHSLKLKNRREWDRYCHGGITNKPAKPNDIPQTADRVYQLKGWVSWGDWLGTGYVAQKLRSFRSFEEAREFVHSLNLKGQQEWNDYLRFGISGLPKLPVDISAAPAHIYKNSGWKSWGDWLGTGTVSAKFRVFRDFKDARSFVHGLNLKTTKEWKEYTQGKFPHLCSLPADIPVNAYHIYQGNGWVSWGDWLGTDYIALMHRSYRPFIQARKFAHSLNLASQSQWKKYVKGELPNLPTLPNDIPAAPESNIQYKAEGWSGWGDWLGTGTLGPKDYEYRTFGQARNFARSLNLKSARAWKQYCKGELSQLLPKPNDIPASPYIVYRDKGWISWPNWLGTGTVYRFKKRDFKDARAFARSLKLKTGADWKSYCAGARKDLPAKPSDIPHDPRYHYRNEGWVDTADWLGTTKD